MDAEARALGAAVVGAAQEGAAVSKAELRARIAASLPGKGKGARHAKAIRSQVYTQSRSGRPTVSGFVYSVLGRGQGAAFVDYLNAHAQGATMRPKAGPDGDMGKYLVIPRPGVSRRLAKDARALAGLGTDPRLQLIPISGGRYLFVRREGKQLKRGGYRVGARATIIAILVRRVDVRRRLSLDGVEDKGAAALVRALAANLGG